jgi:uncharacterized protein
MANAHGDFIWYELITSDPEAARRFYEDVVGWRIAPAEDMPDYRLIWAAENDGVGGVMALPPGAGATGMRPMWLGYVGVDDVDTAAAAAKAAGGAIHMAPQDIPGVGRFAFLSDPQGAMIYVMRGNSPDPSHAFDQAKERHCAWNELSTTDQDGALAIYGSMFGWEKAGGMPMGELGEYSFLKSGETNLGAMMNRMKPDVPPMWVFYFFLNGLDAAVERIKAGGGSIIQEPIEIPGGSFSLVAADPQGAAFGLVGSRS